MRTLSDDLSLLSFCTAPGHPRRARGAWEGRRGQRGGPGSVGGGRGGGRPAKQRDSGHSRRSRAVLWSLGAGGGAGGEGQSGRAGAYMHDDSSTATLCLPAHGHPPASSQLELLGQRVLSQDRGRRVPQAHSINYVKWPRPWHHHAGRRASRGREGRACSLAPRGDAPTRTPATPSFPTHPPPLPTRAPTPPPARQRPAPSHSSNSRPP